VQHILRSDKYRRVTLEMVSGTRAGIHVHGRLVMSVTEIYNRSVTDINRAGVLTIGLLLMHTVQVILQLVSY
jgi:hypothetical protein